MCANFVGIVWQLLLGFKYKFQVAILVFQKLLGFGLYLNNMNFLLYILSLCCLEMLHTKGDIDNENISIMELVVYQEFLVIHRCSKRNGLVVWFCYAYSGPSSC